MMVYIGVDWSTTCCVAFAAGEKGEPKLVSKSVEPTLAEVHRFLGAVCQQHRVEQAGVFIEAGSLLWQNLFHAAGATVHVVDPKQLKRYCESLGSSGAKDDAREAKALVNFGRSPAHRPEPWTPASLLCQQLTMLSSHRERLVDTRTRDIQRLRDDLRRTMPLLEVELSADAKWALALLEKAPTVPLLKALSREDVDKLMKRAAKETRDSVWAAISQTEAPWVDEDDDIGSLLIRQAIERLKTITKQIDEIDRRIDRALTESPEAQNMQTIKGLGPQLSCALIVFGAVESGGDRDASAKRMGAAPVFKGSATTSKGKPKGVAVMRKAVPPRARQATYLLGRLAVQKHPWAAEQYRDARGRGKNSATAYRIVARSLLRIIHAMVRDGTPFDEQRYEASLARRNVRQRSAA